MSTLRHPPAALLGLALALPTSAQTREPQAKPIAEVAANGQPQLARWQAAGAEGTYWVRIPRKAQRGVGTRTIVWLHGANGNGEDHQRLLAAAGVGRDEIVLCPNGSKPNGTGGFNHADGPAPILAAVDDLARVWKLAQVYVGGHSQGAFLTWRILDAHAERFAGFLPCAGGPVRGDAAALRERLGAAAPPLWIVHGESDDVVDVSLDDRAYESFVAAGWPALRYLHPKALGHEPTPVPLAECFEWLFTLTSDRPQELLASAREALAGERVGDALYMLARAARLKAPAAGVQALEKQALARGAVLAKDWTKRLSNPKEKAASEAFYDARAGLLGVATTGPAFDAWRTLRDAQDAPARQALQAARERKDRAALEAITRDWPAAYESVRAARALLGKGGAK